MCDISLLSPCNMYSINVREYRKGQSKMGNPKKLATLGTQETKRRKAKQKLNIICVGHHYMQTNTENLNKTRALLCSLTRAIICLSLCYLFNRAQLEIVFFLFPAFKINMSIMFPPLIHQFKLSLL